MTAALIKYEAACHALAECKSIDEVKTWADKAAAMQAYGRMAKDRTLEIDASEIRIRAERRLGEMLVALKAAGGMNKGQLKQFTALVVNEGGETAPKLADAGISYDRSSRAQTLSAVPQAEFEAELAARRERIQQEGARMSGRLQKAGEREQAKQARKAKKADQQPEPAVDADHDDHGIHELVKELQAETEQLQARIVILSAEDTKAELHKMVQQRDHAVRQQCDAMSNAKRMQDREIRTKRQLMRCGKAVGEENPDRIAMAVEAMAREYRKGA